MEEEKQDTNTPETEEQVEKVEAVSTAGVLPGPMELIKKAHELYKARFKVLISIMLVPTILSLLFAIAFPEGPEKIGFSLSFALGSFILILVQIAAVIALLYALIDENVLTVQEAYKKVQAMFFPYLWVSILVGIITTIGFILLVIPGIIFSVWFSLATFILIIEGKRGFDAITASRDYVKGHWWAVFGRIISIALMALLSVIALGLIILLFSVVPGLGPVISNVGGALLTLILTPFILAYMYNLYTSVRALKGSV